MSTFRTHEIKLAGTRSQGGVRNQKQLAVVLRETHYHFRGVVLSIVAVQCTAVAAVCTLCHLIHGFGSGVVAILFLLPDASFALWKTMTILDNRNLNFVVNVGPFKFRDW